MGQYRYFGLMYHTPAHSPGLQVWDSHWDHRNTFIIQGWKLYPVTSQSPSSQALVKWPELKCKIWGFQSRWQPVVWSGLVWSSLPPLARWGEVRWACVVRSGPARPNRSQPNIIQYKCWNNQQFRFNTCNFHVSLIRKLGYGSWPQSGVFLEKNSNNWELVKHKFERFFVIINAILWQMLQRPDLLLQTSTLRLSQMRSRIVRIMIWSIFLVVKKIHSAPEYNYVWQLITVSLIKFGLNYSNIDFLCWERERLWWLLQLEIS